MDQPTCPECRIEGPEHIVSVDSADQTQGGEPWFHIVYCDACGRIYGVFARHVLSTDVTARAQPIPPPPPLPPTPPELPPVPPLPWSP